MFGVNRLKTILWKAGRVQELWERSEASGAIANKGGVKDLTLCFLCLRGSHP